MIMKKFSLAILPVTLLGASSLTAAQPLPFCELLQVYSLSPSAPTVHCQLGVDGASTLNAIALNPGPVDSNNKATYKSHRVTCTFKTNATDRFLEVAYWLSETTDITSIVNKVAYDVPANGQYYFDSTPYMFTPGAATWLHFSEVGARPENPDTFFNVEVSCQLEK